MNDTYNPLCIKFREGGKENKWGIWIGVDCNDCLIDPISLGNSLFITKKWQTIHSIGDLRILSQIQSETRSCHWAIERNNTLRKFTFRIAEYVEFVLRAITDLHNAIIHRNKQLAYDFQADLFGKYDVEEDLEILIRQIKVLRPAIISPRMRSLDIVPIERLSFVFNERFSDDNIFSIKIGGREYYSCLAEWFNDFERIRHQLEGIVYNSETRIELYDDTGDPTSIHLEEESLQGARQRVMRVTIFPAETDKPIISGYCDSQQAIRALYQGLLGITCNGVDSEYARDYEVDWDQYKFVIYNKLKSPLIENYITGKAYNDRAYSIRQHHIKERYRITADVSAILWDSQGCAYIIDDDDLFETDKFRIKIDGIYQWYRDLDNVVDWADTEVKGDFDWAAWHHRGLQLAQSLRQQLPDEYDLWYGAPYEDKSGTLKEDVLIIKQ